MIYTDYPTQSPFVKQTSYDLGYAFTHSASKSIHVAKTEVAVVNTVIESILKPAAPVGGINVQNAIQSRFT
jgi:hypothetical protein